jgi:hypothetical protein
MKLQQFAQIHNSLQMQVRFTGALFVCHANGDREFFCERMSDCKTCDGRNYRLLLFKFDIFYPLKRSSDYTNITQQLNIFKYTRTCPSIRALFLLLSREVESKPHKYVCFCVSKVLLTKFKFFYFFINLKLICF